MYEIWLRSFHSVAKHGGFTAAANALHLSQPTITEQIKNLEQVFNVELFKRQGRSVKLTDTAVALYEITQGMFAHYDDALRLLRGQGQQPSGRFLIGSMSPFNIMDVVKVYQQQYPLITPVVEIDKRHNLLTGLLDLKLDVAIIGLEVKDSRYCCFPYRQNEIKVLVSAQHKWAQRSRIDIKELANAPMILREKSASTRDVFEAAMNKAKLKFSISAEIDNRAAIREAVACGLGLGLATDAGEQSLSADLHAISVSGAILTTQSHLVCIKKRTHRPLIQAFIKTALATAAPH